MVPGDRIKVLLQIQDGSNKRYSGPIDVARKVFQEAGIAGLYKVCVCVRAPTPLARQCPQPAHRLTRACGARHLSRELCAARVGRGRRDAVRRRLDGLHQLGRGLELLVASGLRAPQKGCDIEGVSSGLHAGARPRPWQKACVT